MQPAFGLRMREERLRRGLSQADLASEGVSTSYVSLLESGRRVPTRRAAEAIAQKLQVDAEYLLGGQPRAVRREREVEISLGKLQLEQGDPDAARSRLEVLFSDQTGEADEVSWTLEHTLARARERCGDLEGAISLLERLRERAEADRARWPWLEVVIDLSRCYREAGDLSRALDVAERAAEEGRALGLAEARDYPRLVATLAAAARERGDLTYSAQLLQRLLQQLDASGSRRDRGSALWNASVIAADRGHFGDAAVMAEQALTLFAEEDDARAEGLIRTNLAWMLLDGPAADPNRALELLMDARERLLLAGFEVEVAYAETELARASLQLSRLDEAERWARSSLERVGAANMLEASRARAALAAVFLMRGEGSLAVEQMETAARGLAAAGSGRQAATIWRDLGDLHELAGDARAAMDCWSRALELVGLPATGRLTRGVSGAVHVDAPAPS